VISSITLRLLFITLTASIAWPIGMGAQPSPPDLSAAKALYASASYEDALAALAKINDEDVELVEQYRALCLLALGRTNEARQSLERMITLQPTYTISDADVSPRLVALFHEVRKQLLPTAAKKIYSNAKASFESKNYVAASAQFKAMFAILEDPDMADQAGSLADLKMLGEGFVALSESQLAAALKPEAPPTPTPSAAAPSDSNPPVPSAPVSAAKSSARIYTSFDKDVTPPIEIDRRMPPWVPANAVEQRTLTSGLIVVVIDEKGTVESVALQKSVLPGYDALLLQAAKAWQFRAARLNGQPVKYSKVYEISLKAR
jgi:tetratricopeptide (TPR) repeat protein